jgi:hypothetical protein
MRQQACRRAHASRFLVCTGPVGELMMGPSGRRAGCISLATSNCQERPAVDPVRLIMLLALTLFLAEGLTLSMFPTQFREFLLQMDPRLLQAVGLAETILAAGLMAGILLDG